jgi:hypothetical protein
MISDKRKLYNKEYQAEYKDRAKRVSVTLTNAEYSDLAKRAKAEGIKPTALLKNMAIAYHQQAPIMPEMIRDELQELRFLIRNVANNINQIAHHSNTIKRLADENGLLLEIQKMETTINDFITQRMKK